MSTGGVKLAPLASLLVLLAVGTPARAATYVEETPLGRTSVGVSVYGGAPLGHSDDARASVLGGFGTELLVGYSWLSGFGLHGVVGSASWSSHGPLGSTLHDADASLLEGYAGLSLRWSFGSNEVAPFAGALLLADVLRVRGMQDGDATGFAFGGQLGLRWHDAPWDVWGAFDLRNARLSSPYEGADRMVTTRLCVVLGVAFEGGVR